MTIALDEQIACVAREIRVRKRAYPRWVAAGKMTQEDAAKEIAAMEAVRDTLTQQQRPDFLSDALNSGDGTYRP